MSEEFDQSRSKTAELRAELELAKTEREQLISARDVLAETLRLQALELAKEQQAREHQFGPNYYFITSFTICAERVFY